MDDQSLHDKAKETVRQLIEQREEILRAFVAKYECGPEEIIQIMQQTNEGVKFCVRRKTDAEHDIGSVMHYLAREIEGCNAVQRRANISSNKMRALIAKVRGDAFREIRAEMEKRTVSNREGAKDAKENVNA